MKNYALLDENNLVINVSTAGENWDSTGWIEYTGKNCAIGFTYNVEADIFIEPQPFASWSLDENFNWQPPIPKPSEGYWLWNEPNLEWVEIETLAK